MPYTVEVADPAKVLSEALDLPTRERLRLAGALLRSVDPEEDDDAAEAWIAEFDRRVAALPGEQLIDATDAHARVLATLRARRTAR